MNKVNFIKRDVFVFHHFGNKGYSLFACLGREVVISVLSVSTLATAKAESISTMQMPSDTMAMAAYKELTLGEVSVTGSRAPQASGRNVRMVSVLEGADIASAPAQSVNDLLKYVAGVDVRQRGPLGAQADVGIRGGNYEQMAILLNGINICDPQTGHNAFDFPVDISEIERIEVLKGPAGRVYGTSSLLGSINIITKSPSTDAVTARVEGGSYGYASAAATAGLANGLWVNSLSASYTRSDGYSRNKEGGLNADYSGVKAFYQGGYVSDAASVRWHAGLSSKGYGANTFYGVSWDDQYERTMKAYTALQAEAQVGGLRLRSALYWNHGDDRFELYRGSEEQTPFNYHRYDVFGVNLNTYFDTPLGRTAIGAELRNEDVVSTTLGEELSRTHRISGTDRYYLYGLNRTGINIMLEHNVSYKWLTLSGGLVAAKDSWSGGHMRAYPGVDVSCALGRGCALYASYNTSLRLPSVTELYYSVGGYEADEHLQPEELDAVECGVRYVWGGLRVEAAVYYNAYKNMIDWIRFTDDGTDAPWQSVNFTRVNAIGAEVSVRLDFGKLVPRQKVLRSLSVDYNHISQDKDLDAGVESLYALEYLRHKVVAKADISVWRNLAMSLSCRWQDRTGTYTDTDGVTRDYQPYAVADVRLAWTASRYCLYVDANNIFNKSYVDYGNVEQPGTWIVAGASVNINL